MTNEIIDKETLWLLLNVFVVLVPVSLSIAMYYLFHLMKHLKEHNKKFYDTLLGDMGLWERFMFFEFQKLKRKETFHYLWMDNSQDDEKGIRYKWLYKLFFLVGILSFILSFVIIYLPGLLRN